MYMGRSAEVIVPIDFASFKPTVDLLNIQVPESNQSKEAGKLESCNCDKGTHSLFKISWYS